MTPNTDQGRRANHADLIGWVIERFLLIFN